MQAYIPVLVCVMNDEIAGAYRTEAEGRRRAREVYDNPEQVWVNSDPLGVKLLQVVDDKVMLIDSWWYEDEEEDGQ